MCEVLVIIFILVKIILLSYNMSIPMFKNPSFKYIKKCINSPICTRVFDS
jgi:hypothetical protein